MIAEGTPASLIEGISGTVVSFMLPESVLPSDASGVLGNALGVDVRLSGRLVEATVERPTEVVHRATGWAIEQGVELVGLSVKRASLEDVFLQLTEKAGKSG